MDCKVEAPRKTYQERLRFGGRFYKRLLILIAACLLICAGGLGYLWYWLERYETKSVNGAMTRYMEKVGNHEWHEIYLENTENFLELNDEATYTTYLVWLYGDRNVGGMTFAYSGGDDYSTYYDVYYQQEKLCALEVRKPEGSATWKVRTVSQDHEYTFDVIDGASFSINGHQIDDGYSHEDNILPYGFRDTEYPDWLPKVKRYKIGSFIAAPGIDPDRSNDIVVRDSTDSHFYIGPAPTAEQKEIFTKEVQDTTIAYCEYITQDGTFYALNQHLFPNTDFYYAITGFDTRWFSEHDSIEFANMEVFDLIPVGDRAFIGSVSFDYIVTAGELRKTYSSTYQLFFMQDDYGNWLLTKLSIISDTGEHSLEN